MKKSDLIKIIKEEISNLLSEKEQAMSTDLSKMSKEEMKEQGAKTLFNLIDDQCTLRDGEYTTAACKRAVSVYRNLNPTGSL